MKTKDEIKTDLAEIVEDYALNPVEVCKNIDVYLTQQGFTEAGGEMARVQRWTAQGHEDIILSFDPERGHVSIQSD